MFFCKNGKFFSKAQFSTDDELEADGAELGRGDELQAEHPGQRLALLRHHLVHDDAEELSCKAGDGHQKAGSHKCGHHFRDLLLLRPAAREKLTRPAKFKKAASRPFFFLHYRTGTRFGSLFRHSLASLYITRSGAVYLDSARSQLPAICVGTCGMPLVLHCTEGFRII